MSFSYKELMPVFLAHFKEDYDCRDDEDILRKILEKEKDVDDIVKSPQSEQAYRLFWLLRDEADTTVERFVEEGLKANYEFLMSEIKTERRLPSLNTENYISEVNRLYNDNQRFTQYNVPRIKPYLKLQNALLQLRPSKNVLVEGVLGAGKHWLVLDVCSSYVVQRKMDFKIYWFDMRNCSTEECLLEKLRIFLHQLAPDLRTNSDLSVWLRIESVKTELRHILKDKTYKNCLLVLRDVQNIETWKAFNIGCKILLTTRQKSVVEYLSTVTTTRVTLKDALTSSEIESLFAKHHCNEPHELVKELTTTTNPRKLSIIAESIAKGLCTKANWQDAKLTTIIERSLKELDSNDRQLYEALFIFPKSAHIPIKLLDIIWSNETSMSVVNKFYEHSLVEKPTAQTITLPGIYSELNLTIKNEAALNKQIVDYYNIPGRFEQCEDTTLTNLDCYFYSHIGHHLSKLSNDYERVHLFRKVFLDFRFLDQKIRNDTTPWDARGSILHTLQVLKLYRAQIVGNEPQYEHLVNAILELLPKVEEKLIISKYSSLLQIALMTEEGPVYEEALRQAHRFPDYVWFTEHGRFHQHRQIINLGNSQVLHANYLDNDFCLMALSTNQLLLTDVSLEGNTMYWLSDENDPSSITGMRVFNKQMHLLTLHSNGILKLWSLQQLRQAVRPVQLAQASKQVVNSIVKLSINNAHNGKNNGKISAFYLDEKDAVESYSIQLHVAFSNGDICICDWENTEEIFKKSITPILKTQQENVRCFSKVLDKFYVLCTVKKNNNTLSVWDLRNSCNVSKNDNYASQNDTALSMETYTQRFGGRQYTILLLIYKYSVWRLRFEHVEFININTLKPEALHISDMSITITCGKRSSDGRYLILGTSEGLIVYDLKLSESVLRSNVSEHIVCCDIYDINDPIFKYIVLCAAAGKSFLHVHTLRNIAGTENNAITWVHHDESVAQSKSRPRAHLEPNVYLRPLLQKSTDGTLFTIDTKARIHKIQSVVNQKDQADRRHSTASWSTLTTPQMADKAHITALCPCKDNTIYAGYNNGKIMNICDNIELTQQYITEPIDYLKQLNSQILIASARNAYKTIIFKLATNLKTLYPLELEIDTMYARLFEDRFLLMFSELGVFFIDVFKPQQQLIDNPDDQLVGFDLKDQILFLAFRDSTIKVYSMNATAKGLNYQLLSSENLKSLNQISYLTASNDGDMLALGFKNGDIKLYTYEENCLELIYAIIQGHQPCYEMKLNFSLCKQVLVSCAEQLCFWNVKHMRNNQTTQKPLSRRHAHWQTHLHTESREEVDASPWSGSSTDQMCVDQSIPHRVCSSHAVKDKAFLWSDKRGNAEFPVLLACIKFVGNEARRFYTSANFTQFYVIDDEGVFYHLKLLEYRNESKPVSIAETQPLRELVTLKCILPTEELLTSNDVIVQDDDHGIDVVGNDNSLPLKSAFSRTPNAESDVI